MLCGVAPAAWAPSVSSSRSAISVRLIVGPPGSPDRCVCPVRPGPGRGVPGGGGGFRAGGSAGGVEGGGGGAGAARARGGRGAGARGGGAGGGGEPARDVGRRRGLDEGAPLGRA